MRALWYEFPDEPELFGVDRQYLVGRDLLVTPVLTPNVSTVDGIFPGRGRVTWRDWYTHEAVNATVGANTTLAAPLGHINVHVRDGAALLLHAAPGYTTTETRAGPFSLLVSLSADGHAHGTAYVDDGESAPPTPHRSVAFTAAAGALRIASAGAYRVAQKLETVTVLGVAAKPSAVHVGGKTVSSWEYTAALEKLVISGLSISLNAAAEVQWK